MEIDCENLMRFMTCSEEFPLPRDRDLVRAIMQRRNGLCVVVKDSRQDYFVGELNAPKFNNISYSLITNGQERHLLYSNLDKLFIPKLA